MIKGVRAVGVVAVEAARVFMSDIALTKLSRAVKIDEELVTVICWFQ